MTKNRLTFPISGHDSRDLKLDVKSGGSPDLEAV
jgi:hypothetical protein